MITRVVVTGASGRLGQAVIEELEVSAQFEVTRFVSPRRAAEPGDVVVDLSSAGSVQEAIVRANPDAVVHLGGVVPGRRTTDLEKDFSINHTSTAAIVASVAETGARVVLASTAGVYGDAGFASFREDSRLVLASDYARSKQLAERHLLSSAGETVALRIFNIFGPGFSDSLIAKLAAATAARPAQLRVWHSFVRDYVHSADVARAIRLAVDTALPSQHVTLNIGSGVATPNSALVEAVAHGGPIHYTVVDWPPSWSVADTAAASAVLGFSTRHTPADGAASGR